MRTEQEWPASQGHVRTNPQDPTFYPKVNTVRLPGIVLRYQYGQPAVSRSISTEDGFSGHRLLTIMTGTVIVEIDVYSASKEM